MNTLNTFDWGIVVVSVVICFIPALMMMGRAGKNTAEFFGSGRAAPWWLIGVSMVATTFSTDTPNLVTDLVRSNGVAGNWVWWAFLLTGMSTVFFFARLWRRSGVLTDLEFYELRYSGREASWVRGFRAIYLGLIFNSAIMATVNLAAVKIANVMLGLDRTTTLAICIVLNVLFAATSGLWGVLVVDFIQFGIAMAGSFAAAWFALKHPAVGGLHGMIEKLPANTLNLLPDFSNKPLTLSLLIIPLTVQWWSVWYPGAEPGGGSYIAQRMLAAKSEKDALAGTLFFNVAHYALRSWPWIIVALCSMIVFPTIASIQTAIPHVNPDLVGNDLAYSAMLTFLPHGFLGLMIAGLLAAYISTLVTHLNWGSSYLVHDFWRRFVLPGRSEKEYVSVGRWMTLFLMLTGCGFTFYLTTAKDAFGLLLSIGAGTGLLYLLRWFWWRINAWCEIAAMASSLVIAFGFFFAKRGGAVIEDTTVLLTTVGVTSAVWILTAFVTAPTAHETLVKFYEKVRPAGPGWAHIRAATGLPPSPDSPTTALLAWVLGVFMVYGALFGTGSLLYGRTTPAAIWLATFVITSIWLSRILKTLWRSSPEG